MLQCTSHQFRGIIIMKIYKSVINECSCLLSCHNTSAPSSCTTSLASICFCSCRVSTSHCTHQGEFIHWLLHPFLIFLLRAELLSLMISASEALFQLRSKASGIGEKYFSTSVLCRVDKSGPKLESNSCKTPPAEVGLRVPDLSLT